MPTEIPLSPGNNFNPEALDVRVARWIYVWIARPTVMLFFFPFIVLVLVFGFFIEEFNLKGIQGEQESPPVYPSVSIEKVLQKEE